MMSQLCKERFNKNCSTVSKKTPSNNHPSWYSRNVFCGALLLCTLIKQNIAPEATVLENPKKQKHPRRPQLGECVASINAHPIVPPVLLVIHCIGPALNRAFIVLWAFRWTPSSSWGIYMCHSWRSDAIVSMYDWGKMGQFHLFLR